MKIAPFGMDRNSVARKSLSFLIAGLLAVSAGAAPAQQHRATLEVVEMFVSKGQRFSCSLDVPRAECLGELSAIRDRLSTYRAENLGPWNWILVRSEDWKPLLKDLGARTDSPAMTSFIDRETLLEQSLFAPQQDRAAELRQAFHLPLEQLVTRALTHELGHAFCGDPDERKAEEAAEQIRRGMGPGCGSISLRAAEKIGRVDRSRGMEQLRRVGPS